MERKRVEVTRQQKALLPGYRLLFNKKALRDALPDTIGFANINEDAESTVEGVLYEIPDEYLPRLDESERYPDHYDRIQVTVNTEQGPVRCWTYQAQVDKTATGLVPSRNYLNHILAGKDFLSQQYYEALDKSQTYRGRCACCHKENEILFLKESGEMHVLCQPCLEARTIWGDVRGRPLTVVETETIMRELVLTGRGFPSVQALVSEAVALKLIDP